MKNKLFTPLLVSLALFSAHSYADNKYPNKAISIVVPFSPGGGVDLNARYIAKKLSDKLNNPVVIENKPGAGSLIGTTYVARAPKDGHTLLFTSAAHSITPSLYKEVKYDPVKEFTPVSLIATGPNGIAANPNAPFDTLSGMIDFAKKNPGKLTWGSIGGATTMNIGMALFLKEADINLRHIPYTGTPQSVLAAVTGEVDLVSSGYGSSEVFAREGKLKMLAVTSSQETSMAPGVPTVASAANLPNYSINNWMGILAPAGTDKKIIDKLNLTIKDILSEEESIKFFEKEKNEIKYTSSEEFLDLIVKENEVYSKAVRDLNIQQN